MQDLLALAARLGRDPLVIQGPGGNISLKRDGVMWVKASGTWMAEAEERPILIPIDVAAVLDGLATDDPACETCEPFVRRDLTDLALRPSIETTLHAVMPQRVVVHVHCVETIATACLSDATERLATPLSGLNWSFVPYVRPGASLGRAMAEHLKAGTDVVVLGKHGLVVAADSVTEAARLRAEVSQRLARTPRTAPGPDRGTLEAAAGDGYAIGDDDCWHAIATDPISLSAAQCGSLYPDHVVFLGPGIVAAEAAERAVAAARRCGRAAVPLVVIPGAGVLVHEAATSGARALIRCLADVTSRLEGDDPISPLSADDEAQLLNWDAEKYRQSLDARPS
ncbi:class II aldolase/adducin family protein [Bradyrhizobium sp. STM 3557]|uniref:class II aldolase/adducin family protein n=1 Tax=Bradyrhizobium sp. STM 3557 TaxID=578920 RepID=UPI00388E9118